MQAAHLTVAVDPEALAAVLEALAAVPEALAAVLAVGVLCLNLLSTSTSQTQATAANSTNAVMVLHTYRSVQLVWNSTLYLMSVTMQKMQGVQEVLVVAVVEKGVETAAEVEVGVKVVDQNPKFLQRLVQMPSLQYAPLRTLTYQFISLIQQIHIGSSIAAMESHTARSVLPVSDGVRRRNSVIGKPKCFCICHLPTLLMLLVAYELPSVQSTVIFDEADIVFLPN
eukprot:Gregarina_sp_Poly_1__5556@NODE_2933_length_1536_cov_8_894486_g1849_i0_p2_GENE_NODE_2933_length_1536_cov_8_894486_g1849_i0NODE_2933_length_1536_cov_8_894486_g1849_i0_p2_ORF_typecomplete_len226_score32_40AGA2/PF17366_2/0_027_NODE_2933_length_1536_cov_8_894486_g1849_i06451322